MKDLNDIEKRNPFRVPDNYFEELKARLPEKLEKSEAGRFTRSFSIRIRPFLAVAATVTVLIVSLFTVFYLSNPERKPAGVNDLASNLFVDEELVNINILELEERISESVQLKGVTDFGQDDIIDYLVSENIDVSEIYEQLQ